MNSFLLHSSAHCCINILMLLLHLLSLLTMAITASTNSNSMLSNCPLHCHQPSGKDDCLSIFTAVCSWNGVSSITMESAKKMSNAASKVQSRMKRHICTTQNRLAFPKGGTFGCWCKKKQPPTNQSTGGGNVRVGSCK